MALDQVLLPLDAVVYIDDTPLHVEVARSLGISAIVHVDHETTAAALNEMGLSFGPGLVSGGH
jgi:putative hydrolase of the HAD superfamily